MVIKILSIVGTIIGILLIYAGVKSPQMEISRELLIKATPEIIFPYLNNSQKMNDWMPWQNSDPELKMLYSGPSEGAGSRSSWDSSGKMGTGYAEIIESIPNQSVKTKLEYTKPMVMSQVATMSLVPAENGETLVRWSVTGHNSFLFRLIGIFMNMDKMVGGEFEKGLTTLKTITETVK